MRDRKYFCYEIYKNIAVWSNNGKIGYNPCSFFNGYIKTTDSLDLEEIWNGPERAELKRCVETDTPIPGCSVCYRAEEQGLVSRRLGSYQLYEEYHNDPNIDLDAPQGIDYSVGNLCNLKCVICGPNHSTSWLPDYQKIYPLLSIDNYKYDKYKQTKITSQEFLKNIKSLHFHGGGEPLMSDAHIDLLNKVKKVKGLNDVRVFYNTNATQRASDDLLKLWEECKLVELYFSIDDVGDRFDYQRTGTSWKSVVDNLKWYYDSMPHNHMFNINCTWGYLNLYYLPELVDWHQQNFLTNRYGDPVNLIFQRALGNFNILHLSSELRDNLLSRFSKYPQLQELVNTLAVADRDHSFFWKNIQQLDEIRHTDYKTLFPEWSRLLL